jgi:hypothetical protein
MALHASVLWMLAKLAEHFLQDIKKKSEISGKISMILNLYYIVLAIFINQKTNYDKN